MKAEVRHACIWFDETRRRDSIKMDNLKMVHLNELPRLSKGGTQVSPQEVNAASEDITSVTFSTDDDGIEIDYVFLVVRKGLTPDECTRTSKAVVIVDSVTDVTKPFTPLAVYDYKDCYGQPFSPPSGGEIISDSKLLFEWPFMEEARWNAKYVDQPDWLSTGASPE